jgi:hypothetical protein
MLIECMKIISQLFRTVRRTNLYKILEMILHTLVIGEILGPARVAVNPQIRQMGPAVNRSRHVYFETARRVGSYSCGLIARKRDIVDQRPISTKW